MKLTSHSNAATTVPSTADTTVVCNYADNYYGDQVCIVVERTPAKPTP